MDQPLKERLLGAVVLVTAAVILIPMVLSGPEDTGPDVPGNDVAGANGGGAGDDAPAFSSRIVPLDGQPATTSAPQPVPAPTPEPAPSPATSEARPAPEPVAPPPARPARKPPASAARAPAPPSSPAPAVPRSGWVVQLGSFSNAANARALRDRLRESGYEAFVESSSGAGSVVTRVYVGPESERSRSEEAVERLLKATRLKGIVVRYPPR